MGAKHHFLLLFCPPVRLHLHKREMGLLQYPCIAQFQYAFQKYHNFFEYTGYRSEALKRLQQSQMFRKDKTNKKYLKSALKI